MPKAKRPPNQLERKRLAAELAKRQQDSVSAEYQETAALIREGLFPKQEDFVFDTARQKAAICTRRAGKSFACREYLLYVCLTKPNANCVYINKSRLECKGILWLGKHGLQEANRQYNLGATFNETELRMSFPNGSRLQLVGVDDAARLEALRGQAYDLVIIDEAQAFPNLDYFTMEVIRPALMDTAGRVVLIGTPEATCHGFFFEITKPQDALRQQGWAVHQWSFTDNIYLQPPLSGKDPETGEQIDVRVEAARAMVENGWTEETPQYRREYLAEWVTTDSESVYAIRQLPEEERYWDSDLQPELNEEIHPRLYLRQKDDQFWADHDWEYVIGVDIGSGGDGRSKRRSGGCFAFSVWAYSDTCPIAFEISTRKEAGLIPSQQAEIVRELLELYTGARVIVDEGGQGKGIAQEWRDRFGIPCERADKDRKNTFIQMFNNDLLSHKILLREETVLLEEMLQLPWKKLKGGKVKEDTDSFPNDALDAALYAWRELLAYASREPAKKAPLFGTTEWWQEEEARLVAAMERGRQPADRLSVRNPYDSIRLN